MEDLARELKATDALHDLVVWVVLKEGAEKRLDAMVGKRGMPVLQDTEDVGFQRLYGADRSRAHFVYDRAGCLAEITDARSPEIRNSPRLLLPALEQAARP